MKSYTVTLGAFAVITGTLAVEAESYDDAMRQALARSEQASWPIDEGGAFEVAPGHAFVTHVVDDEGGGDRWPVLGAGLVPEIAAKIGTGLLRDARDLFKHAGAVRTVERIRAALTSAGGAVRHARGKADRGEWAEG